MEQPPTAIVLSEGYTPTTDYYLVPYLENLGYAVSLRDYRLLPPQSSFADCKLLVISRYLSLPWLLFLKKIHKSDIKIIYFMDDDLFDFQALSSLTPLHRLKIIRRTLLFRAELIRLCDEFWFSSHYLIEKYAHLRPVLLEPILSSHTFKQQKSVTVCYHGASSHYHEIDWLIPIIEQVQARSDFIHFELFGSFTIQKKIKHLSRIALLHPMSWSHYLEFTATQQRDIALAPLLNNPFNAARAPTKFYDYARMRAVGLYSDVAPYKNFIRDGQDGFLLPNEPAVWVEKLLQCADDLPQRKKMQSHIQQRLFSER